MVSSRRKDRYSSHRPSTTKSWRKSTDESSSKREDRDDKREKSPKRPHDDKPSSQSPKKPDAPPQQPESEDDYLMTPAEMNALGAKILKAELCGNKALAAQLQARLDKAREVSRGKRIIIAKPEPVDRNDGRGGGGGGHRGRMNAEMHKYKFDDRYSLKGMVILFKIYNL